MRVFATVTLSLAAGTLAAAVGVQHPVLGAWNMTGTAPDTDYVYWLDVSQEADGQLSGMFLNRTGNPVPLADVSLDGTSLVFHQRGRGGRAGLEYRARLEGDRLVGEHTLPARGGQPERVVHWVGTRPPAWPPSNANGAHTYGAPVTLCDGTSLEAWGVQHADRPMNWSIEDGTMTNGERANNLVSKAKFQDFKVEAEYKLGEKSNSGIYIRGRYELQLLDDLGDTTTRRDLAHMAIYGRTAPTTNASKAAGEWQTMSAVVVGNRVTVTLNGQRVQDNVVIGGITGGALDNDELSPGPLMVQGDHSKVWFRRIVVTPITSPGR
jgi:3-keto-disaccharide hydrolase